MEDRVVKKLINIMLWFAAVMLLYLRLSGAWQ
jgi:hypothetical protein